MNTYCETTPSCYETTQSCYEIGQKAEQRFAELLNNPTFSTPEQDMKEHWDVESDGKRYDVKAMKKWKRENPEPTDRMHYVELRNVHGELGWLYGEADYIVFETRRYWIVVNRRSLMPYIEGLTEKDERSAEPEVYKLYQRTGRQDLMTVVPTVDLLAISEEIIKK
jgi:DNA-binding Lrp family transcriptional regulator